MGSLLTIFGFLFLFVCFSSCANHPAISVIITDQGLTSASSAAGPVVLDIIKSQEPLIVNPGSHSFLGFQVNLSSVVISEVSFKEALLNIVPDTGLSLTIIGLKGHIAMEGYWHFLLLTEDINGQAGFNETAVTIVFTIDSVNDGRLSISTSSDSITISSNIYVFENASNFIEEGAEEAVQSALAFVIDEVLPGILASQINEAFSNISNLPMEYFLDPQNLTLIDYSLFDRPIFTMETMTFNFKGDVHAINTSTCGIEVAPFDNVNSNDEIQIFVSENIMQCTMLAYHQMGVIDNLIKQQISQKLPLDGRIALGVDITGVDATVSPAGISVNIFEQTTISRLFIAPEVFITMSTNVSTLFNASLVHVADNLTISGDLLSLVTSINVESYAADMPLKYQQQIQNSNFTALSEQANEFITTNVLPGVLSSLKDVYTFPTNISHVLNGTELEYFNGFIYMGTDVKST